jgi:integrase
MATKLTQSFVNRATAKDGAERTLYWDPTLPGFGLMVTAAGARSFVVQYRHNGASRRMNLKQAQSLDQARRLAKIELGKVAHGKDPLQERRQRDASAKNTLQSIAEEYFERERKRLRTIDDREAAFRRLIFPTFGKRQIADIRRSDINRLLDRIEDENGPVMASLTLAYLRRLMSWHASRSDDFSSPIVRGMTRGKATARERVLSDDELRAVWNASEAHPGPFGCFLRFILLTAARRTEAARMTRQELTKTDARMDWVIPAARYKSNREFVIPLSAAAIALLDNIPRLGRKGFVFTTDGERPIGGYSKFKREFDKACGVTGWTLHDLRRTARSLMSRAGVLSDHAERALGHVIPGVRATYDRHEFHAEKARAFELLATQIERILNPQENVVPLKAR